MIGSDGDGSVSPQHLRRSALPHLEVRAAPGGDGFDLGRLSLPWVCRGLSRMTRSWYARDVSHHKTRNIVRHVWLPSRHTIVFTS